MEQARAFGIDRQVLQQTIAEAALDEEARRLGLGQSDAETMRMIFSDPNFKGANGKFDPARFQATIRQFGFSEQRYIADQRRVSLRRQIAGTISAGIEPPKVMIEALSRLSERSSARSNTSNSTPPRPERSTRRRRRRWPAISTITRPSSARPNIARSPLSRLPRKRSANGRKSPTRMPGSCSSSAATSSERRKSARCRKSCSRTSEEATAARNRIASGLSFDDLAKERGLNPTDVDLGQITKSEIIDPAIADAAFSLPSGEVSQPVQGKLRRCPGQDRQDRARGRAIL